MDDESAIRDMLRTVMKLAGHRPLEAADADQARRVMREQAADLADPYRW